MNSEFKPIFEENIRPADPKAFELKTPKKNLKYSKRVVIYVGEKEYEDFKKELRNQAYTVSAWFRLQMRNLKENLDKKQ